MTWSASSEMMTSTYKHGPSSLCPHTTPADAAGSTELVERYGATAAGIAWAGGVLDQAGLFDVLTGLPPRLRPPPSSADRARRDVSPCRVRATVAWGQRTSGRSVRCSARREGSSSALTIKSGNLFANPLLCAKNAAMPTVFEHSYDDRMTRPGVLAPVLVAKAPQAILMIAALLVSGVADVSMNSSISM